MTPLHSIFPSSSTFPLTQLLQAAAIPSGVKYVNQNVRIMENPTLPRSLVSLIPPCTYLVELKYRARKTPIKLCLLLSYKIPEEKIIREN